MPQITDTEMEHYLMFPEDYCRRCDGGRGPLCAACEDEEILEHEAELDMDRLDKAAGRV